jgi:hypothetical protein
MINISVKSDIDRLARQVGTMGSKQMPFAIAKALTATAKDTQKQIAVDMLSRFQNPTSFTKRAFTIKAARKSDLTAIVFAKDAQARYLGVQIQGSGRRVKGFEKKAEGLAGETGKMLVPTRNVKLDSAGNVSLATIKRIAGAANSKRYFIGVPKGGNRPFGIYQRHNKDQRLTALMVEATVGKYDRRLDLEGVAAKIARTAFMRHLEDALKQAMATAR